jgi:hypothetical protein
MADVKLPPPLTPAYLVGVVNSSELWAITQWQAVLPAGTHHTTYRSPAHVTSMTFSFTDPMRAGKCLAAMCRVTTIKDALTAALSSGCAPSQSPAAGDANLAAMCRPGDVWACVVYAFEKVDRKIKNSMCEVKRIPPTAPPEVCYGFHADLHKSLNDLYRVERDHVITQSETFFLFSQIAQLG